VVGGAFAEGERRPPRAVARGLEREVTAVVDGPRLLQVFANVLKNALEATEGRPDARVEIDLATRGAVAVVSISDNGDGLSAEARDKIFLPFFTTKPTGTGLGMAIVKKIMDLHGGEIEIVSQPGRGTTVRLIIPGVVTPAPAATGEVQHEAPHSHR
jgi:signal transduction histidine kinase